MKSAIAASLALYLFVPVFTFAQQAEWKAGFARVKITPEEPVFMAGYQLLLQPVFSA